jgi:hypothetical protein
MRDKTKPEMVGRIMGKYQSKVHIKSVKQRDYP